jgi:hypothetical protein
VGRRREEEERRARTYNMCKVLRPEERAWTFEE